MLTYITLGSREVESSMALKDKVDGRYHACIIVNQFLSITMLFSSQPCGRSGQRKALQTLPTQRFWIHGEM